MKYLASALILFGLIAFKQVHTKSEIEAAMHYYDHLIKNTDADSIALLFTPDGDLGNIAHGRDSIRNFLRTFKDVKVISTGSITQSIAMGGDTALQKGSYQQVAVIKDKDTVHVKGLFTARWKFLQDGKWHIHRMDTEPINN